MILKASLTKKSYMDWVILDEIENELIIYLKLYVLLYADDTILFSESVEDLPLHVYCLTPVR